MARLVRQLRLPFLRLPGQARKVQVQGLSSVLHKQLCRGLSTIQKLKQKPTLTYSSLNSISTQADALKLDFEDGAVGSAPFLWLRDNCQCPNCFDGDALARKFLLTDLQRDLKPENVEKQGQDLHIRWSDGHESKFTSQWLYERSFIKHSQETYSAWYKIEQEMWGKDLDLMKFNYNSLMTKHESLLEYLLTLERQGAALVQNTPLEEDAGGKLIDHIAFVKASHYGRRSPVQNRENPSNLAFSGAKLGLHTDLPYYDYQAGLIFLHIIQQHVGIGGDTVISDGLKAADIIRKQHPKEFEILTTTDVYFWDKGERGHPLEMENFHKIHKGPIIGLNNDGSVCKISVNNQVRDSHLDIPASKVPAFYQAMKLLDDLLYEHAYTFKMTNGDMVTLDNLRCLHGRLEFKGNSSRHLETTYMDWDEARCRRRRLQENFAKK